MATDQSPSSSGFLSFLDTPSAALERQAAAERAARAEKEAFDTAVDFLEQIFLRASQTRYGPRLEKWIDPEVNDFENRTARASVITEVFQNQDKVYREGQRAKVQYYEEQIQHFVPVVAKAAKDWTFTLLKTQADKLSQLLKTIQPQIDKLAKAASAVRATVDAKSFVLPSMSAEAAREATGASRAGGTVATRLRRMFYMYDIRQGPVVEAGKKALPAQVDAYKKLFTLMTHSRGVEIVDAFSRSAQTGWKFTSELIQEALQAIADLRFELMDDDDLIWKFPPAIAAGVATLGVKNRAGITQFALAWGKSRKSKIEQALEIAGNALFVLDLVGGPIGAAASEVLGFVLAVIGTAVSFLDDVQQDQAAAATAFAERSERLSKGSNKLGTILQGVAAVAAGLAVPGAVSKITGRRTTEFVRVRGPMERTVVTDPKGVTGKAIRRDIVEGTDRYVSRKGAEIAPAQKFKNEYEYTVRKVEAKSTADKSRSPAHKATDETTQPSSLDRATGRKFGGRKSVPPALLGRRERAIRFINLKFLIDMTTVSGSRFTSLGFTRNSKAFWREMCYEYPHIFSPENLRRILKEGRAPRVDEWWLIYHRSQEAYLGDILIHHHVEQGPWAAGIPQRVHRDFYQELHPITNPEILE
jgi:hypothetical protein